MYRLPVFKTLAVFLCLSMVQVELACLAHATQNDQTFADTTVLAIGDAQARTDFSFSTPADEQAFEDLIRANVKIGVITDGGEFIAYWQQNKAAILAQLPTMGPNLNWQSFLEIVHLKYKIIKTDAKTDPSEFLKWLHSITSNPYISAVSSFTVSRTFALLAFLGGVTYGAVVAGPFAGLINSYVQPVMSPIQEKMAVIGTNHLGGLGKWLYLKLFPNAPNKGDLETAKKDIKDLRSIVVGSNYKMSLEQMATNMGRGAKTWSHAKFTWGQMPDGYRQGRDRQMDMVVLRNRDFATALATAVTAAEVQRQGAEQTLDRIASLSNGNARAVYDVGFELSQTLEAQFRMERAGVDNVQHMQVRIDSLQAKLVGLGGTFPQAKQVVENYRHVFAFTRQAAGVLAGNLFHDFQFSDMIDSVRPQFDAMRNSSALDFFNSELGAEVVETLDRMGFEIDQKLEKLNGKPAETKTDTDTPEAPKKTTLQLIQGTNNSAEGSHVIEESGSIGKENSDTPEERVKEAVRAGRR